MKIHKKIITSGSMSSPYGLGCNFKLVPKTTDSASNSGISLHLLQALFQTPSITSCNLEPLCQCINIFVMSIEKEHADLMTLNPKGPFSLTIPTFLEGIKGPHNRVLTPSHNQYLDGGAMVNYVILYL